MPPHDPDRPTDALGRANPRIAPDAVWEKVRADYLGGVPAAEAGRRHGVSLGALRARAAREGWRRSDQPWVAPAALDVEDEGARLDADVEGDLDRVELRDLAWVADRRYLRAVLRGQAAEAMRWRRARRMLEQDETDLDAAMARDEEAMRLVRALGAPGARMDSTDSMDPVFPDPDVHS